MNVREIMTKEPRCCQSDMNIAAATELMWNNDCGVLPVVDEGRLAGIITDRDICIALGTRNRPATDIAVKDVATYELQTCAPDNDVHTAMAVMRRAKVRRLPVINDEGKIEGIIALNDIVLAAERKHGAIGYEEVMNTIEAVSEHRGHKALPAKLTSPPIAVAGIVKLNERRHESNGRSKCSKATESGEAGTHSLGGLRYADISRQPLRREPVCAHEAVHGRHGPNLWPGAASDRGRYGVEPGHRSEAERRQASSNR